MNREQFEDFELKHQTAAALLPVGTSGMGATTVTDGEDWKKTAGAKDLSQRLASASAAMQLGATRERRRALVGRNKTACSKPFEKLGFDGGESS